MYGASETVEGGTHAPRLIFERERNTKNLSRSSCFFFFGRRLKQVRLVLKESVDNCRNPGMGDLWKKQGAKIEFNVTKKDENFQSQQFQKAKARVTFHPNVSFKYPDNQGKGLPMLIGSGGHFPSKNPSAHFNPFGQLQL